MYDYFDIYGTPIKYSSIKEFRIVQKEYIYRPAYFETVFTEQKFMKKSAYSKYVFDKMVPYAAIEDESDRRGIFGKIKMDSAKETVGREVFEDIRETIGDKFNIKAIKGKKYKCVNQAGRVFTAYLDEIPALVMSLDGKFTDVDKDNPMFNLLGDSILPAINMIHALMIKADQTYIFYGNGVQLADVQTEYQRLQYELSQYNQEKKNQKKIFGKTKTNSIETKNVKEIPVFSKIALPSLKKEKSMVGSEQEILEIKNMLKNGKISEEEYKEKLQRIIDSI